MQVRHRNKEPLAAAAARPRQRRLNVVAGPAPGDEPLQPGDGGSELLVPRPKKPSKLEPSFWLSREDALEAQLKALQHNNFPHNDAGIEACYRFAAFDPFARTDYFGPRLDLGQFERFRRIFYTPYYVTLLNLSAWEVSSSLEVSDRLWVARVHVENSYRKEQRDYQFTMERRLGGRYDGVWYCAKLLAEGCTAQSLYGVI